MQFHFTDYSLDVDRRELRRGSELLDIAPQVFDLLTYLVQNRDRVVTKDDLVGTIWGGRIVSDSTLTSSINAVRKAVGDSGEHQSLIRTVARKGIRFVGEVTEGGVKQAASASTASASRQEVTFCRTADGVSLAVASSGSGYPVVKVGTWLTHIEQDWNSGVWEPLIARLSAQFRLIRYDLRGSGLSDRAIAEISFETLLDDIDAVANSLKLKRFALFGFSLGAPMSIGYAARHPDRVSHLVLSGGFSLGWRRHGSEAEIARREALITLIQHGWGLDNPAFRQVFSTRLFPDAPPEVTHWLNELQRVSMSPDNAVRLQRAIGEFDVTGLLPQISVPTLVLHSRGDSTVPFELGLMLARGISNARFVEIDSRNHLPLSTEPAWRRYIDEICGFLAAHSDSAVTDTRTSTQPS